MISMGQLFTVPVVGVSLNGDPVICPKCEDSEQALDIEMAISMAPGLKQVVVYVGKSDVSIFNQMAADNTSKQLSCSWGWKAVTGFDLVTGWGSFIGPSLLNALAPSK
jgi:hypothetical protein